MDIVRTSNPLQDAANQVAEKISSHLAEGRSVLWLLSGGSGAKIALLVAESLRVSNISLDNLSVSMTDERYGPLGHSDENWQQLIDAGLYLPGANLYRPLRGIDRRKTTQDYARWLQDRLLQSDYKIAIFGIGTDCHTAGIKPGSTAVTSDKLAADFSGTDYERITMTFQAIRLLDEAVIQLSGHDKLPILARLLRPDNDLGEFPAEILHDIPACSLYTDLNHDDKN